MAIHESLDMAKRTGAASDASGRWLPVAGRTGDAYPWTVTCDVGDVESGSVTVRVEVAPVRDDAQAVTVHTFAARSAPTHDVTTVTLSGYLERGYLRAVANIDGTASVGVRAEAPFFNVETERDRLSEAVQKWDQRAEAAARAERDLINPYRRPTHYGYGYALDMAHHAFPDDLRDAIAEQIEHRFQLRNLGRSADASAKVSLRESTAVDRTARSRVARYGPVVFL